MLSQFSFTEIQSWFQLTPTLTALSMPDLVPPWPVLALLTPETHQCWLLLVLPTSSQYDQIAIKWELECRYFVRFHGAVFIYRSSSSSDLTLSQTLLSPQNSASHGFGHKLSDPRPKTVDERSNNWVAEGIAVSSPETGGVWYYRTRPVVRVQDQSSVQFIPKSINYRLL